VPALAGRRYRVAIPTAALLSFRLGGTDGVAIEAAKWRRALEVLGYTTVTVAGEGTVDRLLPGLAIGADVPPTPGELDEALAEADLVVVENLCSLPLNPAAAGVAARVLAGRPAVLHHHDLPWQRPQHATSPPPPDDPCWAHVTINERSRRELAAHGIAATTVYNSFDPVDPPSAEQRRRARALLGVPEQTRLALQPTRAIPRKNVAGGVRAAEALDATFWLLGTAEDGFDDELGTVLGGARCPVVTGWPGGTVRPVADAYAACDVVLLPSTWEGFGNPSVESALHLRPLVIGPYPVAAELAAFGFRWFGLDQLAEATAFLDRPDPSLLAHNRAVATGQFSTAGLPERLASVLDGLGARRGARRGARCVTDPDDRHRRR
jgi:glycosyltransferase involved in cell wall biosynthesis